MVKIAISGGSGSTYLCPGFCIPIYNLQSYADLRSPDVGREVVDALAATGKHEIVILSRNVRHHPNHV